jgi:hypothetical protein
LKTNVPELVNRWNLSLPNSATKMSPPLLLAMESAEPNWPSPEPLLPH